MRFQIAALLLVLSAAASGQGWEYKVISLPFNLAPDAKPEERVFLQYEVLPDGTSFEIKKTEVINKWAAQGWECVGLSGPWANVLLLRRAKP